MSLNLLFPLTELTKTSTITHLRLFCIISQFTVFVPPKIHNDLMGSEVAGYPLNSACTVFISNCSDSWCDNFQGLV